MRSRFADGSCLCWIYVGGEAGTPLDGSGVEASIERLSGASKWVGRRSELLASSLYASSALAHIKHNFMTELTTLGSPLFRSPKRNVRRTVSAGRGQSLNWGAYAGSSGKNTFDWHCATAMGPFLTIILVLPGLHRLFAKSDRRYQS